MNAYAIQRVSDGAYVAPKIDHFTYEPHESYKFVSREAAQQYIDQRMEADRWLPAILPSTRLLLSDPQERAA